MAEIRCAICHRLIAQLAEVTPMRITLPNGKTADVVICSTCVNVPPKDAIRFG